MNWLSRDFIHIGEFCLDVQTVACSTNPLLSQMLRQSFRFARPARLFSTSTLLRQQTPKVWKTATSISEVVDKHDLVGPGAQPGTVPTDLEQATGLERFELLGKLEGVEVFDNIPLDSSRTGTMADPIVVDSYDDYRYVGCTGAPADTHEIQWLKPTTEKVARCWECGSVYKLNYLGTPGGHHHH
ncbi:unnamed protein product [Kuraishia capsulata CBS 1993]|uniref:Cytochrome c oxidase subunit 4, mitochondrial n=1 Tax=Kuraishia capsulata CBS 1993 TaxID=1382522 RepID=W6MLH9_9ASCO|nr:uncharacterized protein KUCA_T00003319001 [Kuraishia capsulata CBS 1993]CDK27341.1 unnamed protein product [Kuraishia capsulata CBS 1993]